MKKKNRKKWKNEIKKLKRNKRSSKEINEA